MAALRTTADELLHAVALALARAEPALAPAEALAEIGPRLDADRVWFVRFDLALSQWWVAHEWCAPGVAACLPELPGVPTALIARPMVDFRRGRPVVYHDIEKIPADAQALKEEMRREGNRATAASPVLREGRLVALMGLDDTRKIHRWSAAEMSLLGRLGELVLAAADRAERLMPPPARPPESDAERPASPPPSPAGCYLRAGSCHVQVHWEDIVLLSAEDDYARVRLRGGREFFDPRPLAIWETILPTERFGRVHRSWIVAWPAVRRLHRRAGGRWTLELHADPRPVPVGRSFQEAVRLAMNLRLG